MTNNTLPEGIFIKKGKAKGKTVAIFGGIHGNEKVGVKMIDILRKKLEVQAGTVCLVYGNPKAIKQNKRFIEKNLNRCFKKGNKGETLEDKRAMELMKILDECDALLDLHAFPNSQGEPFAICEQEAFDIAEKFNVPVISSGWGKTEPGATEGYMYNNGKIGIGIECGSDRVGNRTESLERAKFVTDIFLKYFGCINGKIIIDNASKKYVKVFKAIIRKSKNFKFSRNYKNFDSLKEGEIFAIENRKKFIAKKDECIVLPTPNEPIGGEICILGREIKSSKK